MKGHRDLQIVAGLSLLGAALALLVPLSGLALVFAAPLALLTPGYAITAATFARRTLEWPQFLLLSLALSLATLVLGSLVLNYLPGGIRAISWALLLVLVVLNGCRAAALRRRGSAAPRWPRPRLRGFEVGLLLAGLAATVAALVLASATVPAENAVGYTQLWILPEAGSQGREVQVGVKSEEQDPVEFDLRVRLGERRTGRRPLVERGPAEPHNGAGRGLAKQRVVDRRPAGQRVLRQVPAAPEVVRRSFELEPGETRVVRLSAPPGAAATMVPVVATLLRHNRPYTVYRRVKGWLVAPKGR